MRKTMISFLLFCITYPCVAKKQHEYNVYINQAELCITNDQYKNALLNYDSAFASTSFSFGQDLFNAAVCAINLKLIDKAFSLCNALADHGAGDDFFTKNEIFKQLPKDKAWNKLIGRARKSKEKFSTKNKFIKNQIDSLVAYDQKVNKDWRSSGFSVEKNKIMDSVYDNISKALLNLFKSKGYLGEKELGIHCDERGEISRFSSFDVIIIHNYESRGHGDSLFSNTLRVALQSGVIKADHYARIRDFAGSSDNEYYATSHCFVLYKCGLYKDKYVDTKKAEINRAKLGLSSVDEILKKIIFNINHPGNPFLIFENYSKYMNFKDKESENYFLKGNEIVIEQVPNCLTSQ